MSSQRPRVAVLPDMDDARLLVDLTSHASDLSEASDTLAQAFAAGESSPLWAPGGRWPAAASFSHRTASRVGYDPIGRFVG